MREDVLCCLLHFPVVDSEIWIGLTQPAGEGIGAQRRGFALIVCVQCNKLRTQQLVKDSALVG